MSGILLAAAGAVRAAEVDDTQREIAQHLAAGQQLLEQGRYEAAQAEFRAILKIDATHRDALRFVTQTHQRLEAQRTSAAAEAARLRKQAEALAEAFAREKAKAFAAHTEQTQQQLAAARGRQLKQLYQQGLALHRQARYAEAIQLFEQLALVDPAHPLVKSAQALIARSESKLAEARARAGFRESGEAGLAELESQLTAKRIELETVLKFAKQALRDRKYDLAIQLTQRILVQDPAHAQAQKFLEQAQLAKAGQEQQRLERLVQQDERGMIHDVLRAQQVPPTRTIGFTPPAGARGPGSAGSDKLMAPVSFAFEEVPLSDVLEFLADAAGVSILPSPQLDLKTRLVSLKVDALPLESAIKYLAKSQGLAFRVEGDVVLIASAEEFDAAPMETRVFMLRSGLTPLALETSAVARNEALAMDSLRSLIDQTVPQPSGSKVVLDERSGSLILTNTPENLRLMEDLLRQLDVAPLQVLIEARFIELVMTELEQFQLESVLTGAASLSKKELGASTGPGTDIASGGGFKFPSLDREGEGVNLTLQGVLTGTQFETTLHALQETDKSKTLSAPRVTTLNNQTALIRVVEEFRYPTRYEVSLIQFDINGDGDFDDAGETEFANVPQDFQKRDVGILLAVTPSVSRDGKTMTLILSPEVSAFSKFRELEGGVILPEFTTSQLTTSVLIEHGQTVVLGGLMKDTTTDLLYKIPVLGDIPLLGGLFRQHKTSSARRNLLIFITARVLAPSGSAA